MLYYNCHPIIVYEWVAGEKLSAKGGIENRSMFSLGMMRLHSHCYCSHRGKKYPKPKKFYNPELVPMGEMDNLGISGNNHMDLLLPIVVGGLFTLFRPVISKE